MKAKRRREREGRSEKHKVKEEAEEQQRRIRVFKRETFGPQNMIKLFGDLLLLAWRYTPQDK